MYLHIYIQKILSHTKPYMSLKFLEQVYISLKINCLWNAFVCLSVLAFVYVSLFLCVCVCMCLSFCLCVREIEVLPQTHMAHDVFFYITFMVSKLKMSLTFVQNRWTPLTCINVCCWWETCTNFWKMWSFHVPFWIFHCSIASLLLCCAVGLVVLTFS